MYNEATSIFELSEDGNRSMIDIVL